MLFVCSYIFVLLTRSSLSLSLSLLTSCFLSLLFGDEFNDSQTKRQLPISSTSGKLWSCQIASFSFSWSAALLSVTRLMAGGISFSLSLFTLLRAPMKCLPPSAIIFKQNHTLYHAQCTVCDAVPFCIHFYQRPLLSFSFLSSSSSSSLSLCSPRAIYYAILLTKNPLPFDVTSFKMNLVCGWESKSTFWLIWSACDSLFTRKCKSERRIIHPSFQSLSSCTLASFLLPVCPTFLLCLSVLWKAAHNWTATTTPLILSVRLCVPCSLWLLPFHAHTAEEYSFFPSFFTCNSLPLAPSCRIDCITFHLLCFLSACLSSSSQPTPLSRWKWAMTKRYRFFTLHVRWRVSFASSTWRGF